MGVLQAHATGCAITPPQNVDQNVYRCPLAPCLPLSLPFSCSSLRSPSSCILLPPLAPLRSSLPRCFSPLPPLYSFPVPALSHPSLPHRSFALFAHPNSFMLPDVMPCACSSLGVSASYLFISLSALHLLDNCSSPGPQPASGQVRCPACRAPGCDWVAGQSLPRGVGVWGWGCGS